MRRGVRPTPTRMSSPFRSTPRVVPRGAMPICAAVAAMCAPASLLNPYGADGSLYVLKSLGEASYGGAIVECTPMGPAPAPFFAVPIACDSMGSIALSRRAGRKSQPAPWQCFSAGIAAGILHSRCMWIAGLSCGLCCAFDSQVHSGARVATRRAARRGRCRHGPCSPRSRGSRIAGTAIERQGSACYP